MFFLDWIKLLAAGDCLCGQGWGDVCQEHSESLWPAALIELHRTNV